MKALGKLVRCTVSFGICAALLGLTGITAWGQQGTSSKSLSLPSQDQFIELHASLPEEVQVGESFEYQVRIQNTSQNIVVRDIKIEQAEKDGIVIQSAQMKGDPQQQAEKKEDKAQNEQKQQQSQDSTENKSQAKKAEAKQTQSNQSDEQASEQASSKSGRSWTIDELRPGESRTVSITATSHTEGQLHSCLAITSFTPVLCLTTRSVKPELEIVKQAPEESNLCSELEWEYFIKNTGSGDPGMFTVIDELPAGIQTVTGEKRLEFKVDGIEPGDVRKFVANLRATKPGDFRSAATAKRGEGKTTRSQEVGTKIVTADLALAIDGPDTRYVNRLADYQVRVTNNGEAIASNVRLEMRYPGELQMAYVGEPQQSDQSVPASQNSRQSQEDEKPQSRDPQEEQSDQSQPTDNSQASDSQASDAQASAGQLSNEKQQTHKNQQQIGKSKDQKTLDPSEAAAWEIGDLAPGETIELAFSARSGQAGQAKLEATATFACGTEKERATSYASTRTRYIALPALMLAVVDNKDPVAVEDQVEYVVVVGNEGEVADRDVQISVQLPEQLEFVKGSGETDVTSEGQNLTFAPVKELRPGEKVRWTILTKATDKGNVRFQVQLKSEFMQRATKSEEPTVLFAEKQASTE